MAILDTVQQYRADRNQQLRETAIGGDLIPRAEHGDARYAGVDLGDRGRDITMLRIGMRRLTLTPDDLPAVLKAMAERIAGELREAGPDEIGRWATDVLSAYGDVPNLSPHVEVAMYAAWSMALQPVSCAASRACTWQGPCRNSLVGRACEPAVSARTMLDDAETMRPTEREED